MIKIIFNPGSHSGRSSKTLKKIENAFKIRGIDYEIKITQKLSDAYSFALDATVEGCELIVAVGGDGTINGVINGILSSNITTDRPSLGVIYTGTSPDFCKSYNIPYGDVERSLESLFLGFKTSIKIGVIEGEKDKRYFSICSNIGLGSDVAKGANSGLRRYLGDFLGTFISMIKAFIFYTPRDMTVIIDGVESRFKKVVNISVGRCKYIASGIKVNYNEGFNGKGFYILVIHNIKFSNFFRIIYCLYHGVEKEFDGITLQYANTIKFNVPNFFEADGDPIFNSTAEIRLSKMGIDLINGKNND